MPLSSSFSPLPQVKEEPTPPQPDELAQAGENNQDSQLPHLQTFTSRIVTYLPKALGLLLGAQGLHSLYKSMVFIFIDYPQLNLMLDNHQLLQSDINSFASKAVVEIIMTAISLFFAMRLTFFSSKVQERRNIIISAILVPVNFLLTLFFNNLELGESLSENLSQTTFFFTETINRLLPF